MLMFHSDQTHTGQGNCYAVGWRGVVAPTASEVAELILTYPVSPCMWGGGVRKKSNFRFADWIGLDFDEGLSLADACIKFEQYVHIIGTTKSHQVEKGGKTCDRFRVFLKFGVRCTNREDYEATADELIKKYGADKACRDAARFFWPCKKIVVCKYWGKVISPVDSTEVNARKIEAIKNKRTKLDRLHANGSLPCQVDNMLRFGVPANKNDACYFIAACLAERGFSEDEAFLKIWNSAIPIDNSSEVEKEVRGAVRRGYAKGLTNPKAHEQNSINV